MKREDAQILLQLAKRQVREGCGTPPADSERMARRFVQALSDDVDGEDRSGGQ